MSNLEIKAAELILTHKKEDSKAFLDTFIFEPENIEEQNLGSLYIIGEITDMSANSEYLINLLVATIKKEYYLNTNREPMESLESSLNKTNEMLADFAEKGNIGWIGNLNIIVAVLKNSILYFSQTGRAKALLIRGKSTINIGQDLVSELKPHPLKTFSNIANGQVDGNDKLLLATSGFSDNISDTELRNIIAKNENAENILEKFASSIKESDVALIFLETKPKSSNPMGIRKIMADDIEKLKREIEPENVKEYSRKYPAKEGRLDDIISELNAAEAETALNQKMKFLAKAIRFMAEGTKKILLILWNLIKRSLLAFYAALKPRVIIVGNRLLLGAKSLKKRATGKFKPASLPADSAPASFSDIAVKKENFESGAESESTPRLNSPLQRIKNMPFKKKLAAAGALILILSFGATAANWTKKNQSDKNIQYYAALLDAAEKGEKAAEIEQMYQKNDEAVKLLKETLANTEKLIKANYFVSEARTLREKAIKQMDKLEGVTRIDDPTKIIDFAINSQNIKTNGIIWSGKKLYAFNSDNNAFYKYDFEKKSSQIVAVNSENMGHLAIGKSSADKIIFLTDSPGIAVYDPAKSELKNIPIKFNSNETDIADISTFRSNSSLYLLARNDSGIYKHALTISGYSKGEKWIKDEENPIQNPASIAIDGDIFILQNNSDNPILKFTKGEKKDFTLSPLLIPLKKAARIMTNEALKNIYILDPENRRVIVSDKTGKILKQFTSDKFDNLVDLTINPNEKSLYLLNGTSVYEISL